MKTYQKTLLIIAGIIGIMAIIKYKVYQSVVSRVKSNFLTYIQSASERFKVPIDIISAIISVESSGRAEVADGGVGEIGLMQIRPYMALIDVNRIFHLNLSAADLRNPELNIIAGTAYLSYLEKYFFPGNWSKVIRAYNGGIGNIQRNGLFSITYLWRVQSYQGEYV
jgi:soluble lytic murein transglycosylase-like protein